MSVTLGSASIVNEAQKLNVSPLIELIEIDGTNQGVPSILYFHNFSSLYEPIIFNGVTYQPFPIQVTGMEFKISGELPRPSLRIANIISSITALVLGYNDMVGAKVTRRRTHLRYLDYVYPTTVDYVVDKGLISDPVAIYEDYGLITDSVTLTNDYGSIALTPSANPNADSTAQYPPDIFYIDRKISETKNMIEWELGASLDIDGVMLPLRQIVSSLCGWQYRSAECGYYCPSGSTTPQIIADEKDNLPAIVISNWRDEWDASTVYSLGDGVKVTTPDFVLVFVNTYFYGDISGNTTKPPNSSFWAQDSCSRRVSGCQLRFDPDGRNNELPFGGFPGTDSIPPN